MNKSEAVINFLLSCTDIASSSLYFNFANVKKGGKELVTLSNDRAIEQEYIDGSRKKKFSLTIKSFISIEDIPITISNNVIVSNNVESWQDVQNLIDWINETDDLPDFGTDCIVEEVETTSSNPRLERIDATQNPAIAYYTFTVDVTYIDMSKVIWNKNED